MNPTVDAGRGDVGFAINYDASIPKDTARMLNVVGDPAPTLEYGETVQLTALLVGIGVGAVPNADITFTVNGEGQLSSTTATTNAAGIVTVTFTAPTSTANTQVIATGDKVATKDQATWFIKTAKPQRTLTALSSKTLTVSSTLPATALVSLTESVGGTVIAGGTVTFAVISGSRNNVFLNGQNTDTDTEVTGADGTARLALSVASVAADFTFTVEAREQYSASQIFTIKVVKDVPCTNNNNCKANQICDTKAGKCIPKPQCTTTPDCAKGYVCNGGQCICDPTDPTSPCGNNTCKTNADCAGKPPTIACDPIRQICTYPTLVSCAADPTVCPTGYHCDGKFCAANTSSGKACKSTADCPMGEYCNPNDAQCTTGCDADALCQDPTPICDLKTHTCIKGGCTKDLDCPLPQVCDISTGQCVDAPSSVLDVSGNWDAVQIFHIQGLTPPDVQKALKTIDIIFGDAEAVVDCHVSQFLPDWLQWLIGSMLDDAVCNVVGTYLPDWASSVIHIGANVSKMIQDFEIHSRMVMKQPGDGQTDRTLISGVDTWNQAYFYWYTSTCKTPAPGKPPPQCALVQIDLAKALIQPAPSAFTGNVGGTTLYIDTHDINFKFGKAVLALIDKVVELETKGKYKTLKDALNGLIDCVQVNAWIQQVAKDILGSDYAQYASMIDVTGICNDAKSALIDKLLSLITNLNSDVPMSLNGKAGIVQDAGNTSNVADHLRPGIWYGKFNGQGDVTHQFGEWYADRP